MHSLLVLFEDRHQEEPARIAPHRAFEEQLRAKARSLGPILGTRIWNAIFFNHGQCCCAGSRLYVQKKIFDEVVDGVTNDAKSIKVAEGFNPESQMGPLVSEEQLNRVLGFLEAGKADGVKTVVGGNRVGDRGYFVEPTVLTGARRGMKVVDEEIFGPVVCAIPFDELDRKPKRCKLIERAQR